eukprot:scaffold17109_cov55-Isochrysis_galbana.AAC.1
MRRMDASTCAPKIDTGGGVMFRMRGLGRERKQRASSRRRKIGTREANRLGAGSAPRAACSCSAGWVRLAFALAATPIARPWRPPPAPLPQPNRRRAPRLAHSPAAGGR